MKIKILGTAAAEGWPGIFCECEGCRKARALGGKNLRTRSSALLDEDCMIDFPPDTYMHVLNYQLDMAKVKNILITHAHRDHYYPEDLLFRRKGFAHRKEESFLSVYGNEKIGEGLKRAIPDYETKDKLQFKRATPFEGFTADGLQVMPLQADHARDQECLVYLFQREGRTLFYGHDSGYYPEATWEKLKDYRLDVAILECTLGIMPSRKNHMGFDTVLEVRQRMLEEGIASASTVFVITHFSHNGLALHEELEEIASRYGIIVAYDGIEIEV